VGASSFLLLFPFQTTSDSNEKKGELNKKVVTLAELYRKELDQGDQLE
jgi:hypothetical protein